LKFKELKTKLFKKILKDLGMQARILKLYGFEEISLDFYINTFSSGEKFGKVL
jgi:hypothetical protein